MKFTADGSFPLEKEENLNYLRLWCSCKTHLTKKTFFSFSTVQFLAHLLARRKITSDTHAEQDSFGLRSKKCILVKLVLVEELLSINYLILISLHFTSQATHFERQLITMQKRTHCFTSLYLKCICPVCFFPTARVRMSWFSTLHLVNVQILTNKEYQERNFIGVLSLLVLRH